MAQQPTLKLGFDTTINKNVCTLESSGACGLIMHRQKGLPDKFTDEMHAVMQSSRISSIPALH